jgi:uncharacterized protein YceK
MMTADVLVIFVAVTAEITGGCAAVVTKVKFAEVAEVPAELADTTA